MTREEAYALVALGRSARLEPGPGAEEWEERLASKQGELSRAVAWLQESGDVDSAVELAAAVWRVWARRASVARAREILAPPLAAARTRPPTRALALALYADGVLAFREGKQEESHERNEAALGAARAIGDLEAEALALVGLSRVALRAGDYGGVCALATRARALVAHSGPEADSAPLHLLAAGTRLLGDYDRARTLYLESLALHRRIEDQYMVQVELHNLGHVELHRGDLPAARTYFGECAALREGANSPYDEAMERLNRAALDCHQGDSGTALRGLDEAERILADAGIVLDPDDRFEVDWLRGKLEGR